MGNVWSKYVSDIVHTIEFHSHFSSENISCMKINDIFTGINTKKEFMNSKNTTFIGSRWFYAICFIGLFIVETLIALFVRDAFIRPYMGDVLVVILIYFFEGDKYTRKTVYQYQYQYITHICTYKGI